MPHSKAFIINPPRVVRLPLGEKHTVPHAKFLLLESLVASLGRRLGRSALVDFFDYLRAHDTFSLQLDSLGVHRVGDSLAFNNRSEGKDVLHDVAFDDFLKEIEIRLGLERHEVNELLREAVSRTIL